MYSQKQSSILGCICTFNIYTYICTLKTTLNHYKMKKLVFAISLLGVFVLISAFNNIKGEERSFLVLQPYAVASVAQLRADDISHIPGYGKTYLGFKEAIGFKESQGKYTVVNSLGYLGKYQFGKSTLTTLRIYNTEYFLYNSKLQEKAFKANCSYNKWLLQEEIKKHKGTTIKGVRITESGIIAAAHLAGAGSVKRYLRSQGRGRRIIDAFGTNIEQYLIKFADYDISSVKASRYPKL